MKVYGNLTNRLEEGQIVTSDHLIHEGDDITLYHYSDRTCYYVTEVIDQKHIKVRRYYVCADHEKEGGMGHQNWKYFKSLIDMQKYLASHFASQPISDEEPDNEEEWVYRYNNWYQLRRITPTSLENLVNSSEFLANLKDLEERKEHAIKMLANSKRDQQKLREGKTVNNYYSLEKVSIGVLNYYYDWEF